MSCILTAHKPQNDLKNCAISLNNNNNNNNNNICRISTIQYEAEPQQAKIFTSSLNVANT
jgi:hypothetical protein